MYNQNLLGMGKRATFYAVVFLLVLTCTKIFSQPHSNHLDGYVYNPGDTYRLNFIHYTLSIDKNLTYPYNDKIDSVKMVLQPIFMDSTAKFVDANKVISGVQVMKVGAMFDATSENWDSTGAGNPVVAGQGYFNLDTIFIGGTYKISPNDKSLGDTLFIEIAIADTVSGEFYKDTNSLSRSLMTVREIPSPNASNGHKCFQKKTSSYYTFSYVLSAKDTVTVNNPLAGYIVFPLPNNGILVPKHSILSVTYTYIPGANSSYIPGSNVFDLNGTNTNCNGFAASCAIDTGRIKHNYFTDYNGFFNTAINYSKSQQYSALGNVKSILDSICIPQQDLYYDIMFTITEPRVDGIQNNKSTDDNICNIYPNPCDRLLNVEYELQHSSSVYFEVVDNAGEKVITTGEKTFQAGSYKLELNTSAIPNGVYYLTMSKSGVKTTRSFVVTH